MKLSTGYIIYRRTLNGIEKTNRCTNLLEARLGVPEMVEHGPAHAGLVDVGVVLERGAGANARAAAALVARLVEVRLGD